LGHFSGQKANGLVIRPLRNWQRAGFEKAVKDRKFWFWSPTLVLNLHEAASLWHLPGVKLEHVRGIDWGKTIVSEAPDNVPVAELATMSRNGQLTFLPYRMAQS
jgi:hypothetical protein